MRIRITHDEPSPPEYVALASYLPEVDLIEIDGRNPSEGVWALPVSHLARIIYRTGQVTLEFTSHEVDLEVQQGQAPATTPRLPNKIVAETANFPVNPLASPKSLGLCRPTHIVVRPRPEFVCDSSTPTKELGCVRGYPVAQLLALNRRVSLNDSTGEVQLTFYFSTEVIQIRFGPGRRNAWLELWQQLVGPSGDQKMLFLSGPAAVSRQYGLPPLDEDELVLVNEEQLEPEKAPEPVGLTAMELISR